MRWWQRWVLAPTLLSLLLLGACQNTGQKPLVYSGAEVLEAAPEEPPVVLDDSAVRRARMLADILYDARIAFEDNRLMTPSNNNAYDRYREVLELDPGNAVALQGLADIARRYIDLADVALGKGQYEQAEGLLARATRLSPDPDLLQAARQRLAAARESKVEMHALDPAQLSAQSLEMMAQLAEIAQSIMSRDATFLINARTDAEGRWIYKVMREAVGGYRLRANIDTGANPVILVTLPRG